MPKTQTLNYSIPDPVPAKKRGRPRKTLVRNLPVAMAPKVITVNDFTGQPIEAGDFVVLRGNKGATVALVESVELDNLGQPVCVVRWSNGNSLIWRNLNQTAYRIADGFLELA